MINPKELLEDFLALGYDDATARTLTKSEFKRRKVTLQENNNNAKKKREDRPRTNGFMYKAAL